MRPEREQDKKNRYNEDQTTRRPSGPRSEHNDSMTSRHDRDTRGQMDKGPNRGKTGR